MRKAFFNKDDIFEIAKLIKSKFPNEKMFLYKKRDRLILKIPLDIDKLKLEEIKFFIKTKYPYFELSCLYY